MLPPCSPFLPLLPLLLSSLPPLPLSWYPAVISVPPVALATTVAANLATAIAAITSRRHHIAFSCRVSLAIVLTAFIAVLPLLSPLLLPPCCPRPGPSCCHRYCCCCHATLVLTTANATLPRCCYHVATALVALAAILAATVLPPLSLMPPSKLIFWLIVMFPQPLTLSPLVALFCCR